MANLSDFGVIGLGVMGRNLALNVNDHGFSVAVWNLEAPVTDAFVAQHLGSGIQGASSLAELVLALARPRRILLSIASGKPVDEVLDTLTPLLDRGDIVIDGGNTSFHDTERRERALTALGIHFVGMGISGGERGARRGPSLMPGGTPEAWTRLQPVLEAIAAKTDAGPAVAHIGPGGAGHFVKMVHNGIEYGDMQLIAEVYDVLSRGLGLAAPEASGVFAKWNDGPLASYLIEITAKVLAVRDPETGVPLVELVQDRAGQKGTGRWALDAALDLGVPLPTLAAALDARALSSLKQERVAAASKIRGVHADAPPVDEHGALLSDLHDALLAAKICAYAQGFELIRRGGARHGWNITLAECARIWRGGCIIRARLLEDVRRAYGQDPALPNLLCDPELESTLRGLQPAWRRAVGRAQTLGIPVPALSATLAYLDGYRSARLPQNLTQAQRDAFGAHGYERSDKPELGSVHTEWLDD